MAKDPILSMRARLRVFPEAEKQTAPRGPKQVHRKRREKCSGATLAGSPVGIRGSVGGSKSAAFQYHRSKNADRALWGRMGKYERGQKTTPSS